MVRICPSCDVDDTWLFVFISSVVNVTLFGSAFNLMSSKEEEVYCEQKKENIKRYKSYSPKKKTQREVENN